MAEKGIIFGETAAKQIAKTVREVARRTVNEMPQRGRWQQHRGGSGGGHEIWFTITDVLCPDTDYVSETTLVVTATYYNQSCTGTPPGSNDDGTFDVYDLCGYFSYYTAAELVGKTGRAGYYYPLTGSCDPKWIVEDLCGETQCG
jgi:hypothetical protein